jgi:hypothetical protein
MRDILSQAARSGFAVSESMGPFPFEDSQDKAPPPLAQEEKFAPFGVVCGYDPG